MAKYIWNNETGLREATLSIVSQSQEQGSSNKMQDASQEKNGEISEAMLSLAKYCAKREGILGT